MIVLPAVFIENRIIVCPVTEEGGSLRLFTDTGGGCFLMKDAVNRLGRSTFDRNMDGSLRVLVTQPQYQETSWIPPLLDKGEHADLLVLEINETFLAGMDGMLGAAWFSDRIWAFDYLEKVFTYYDDRESIRAMTAGGVGNGVRLYFQKDDNGTRMTSFPRIQAVIDGETIDFLFDTGATLSLSEIGHDRLNPAGDAMIGTSFITQSVFTRWAAKHPDWLVVNHAELNNGLPVIEVPEVEIAGHIVGPVTFTMRPDPNFHGYMTQWMDKRIEGALGGSAFQYFRITVDYPDEMAYFER